MNRLKRWRRVATRYEKRAAHYEAIVTPPPSWSTCDADRAQPRGVPDELCQVIEGLALTCPVTVVRN